MYTESVESEKKFVSDLWKSWDHDIKDGESVVVRACPNCHSGTVVTRCTHRKEDGYTWYHYDHYCDSCGEKFIIEKMDTDIFYHTPYTMLEKLETPFGDISVKINGQTVPFRYRTDTYEPIYEPAEEASKKVIALHIIDIDLSDLKRNDRIVCSMEPDVLEFNSGDENVVFFSCENEKLLFMVCADQPEDYDAEDYCCFQMVYDGEGMAKYQITSDLWRYRDSHYKCKFIRLAVAWVNKADYKDPEMELLLALD